MGATIGLDLNSTDVVVIIDGNCLSPLQAFLGGDNGRMDGLGDGALFLLGLRIGSDDFGA